MSMRGRAATLKPEWPIAPARRQDGGRKDTWWHICRNTRYIWSSLSKPPPPILHFIKRNFWFQGFISKLARIPDKQLFASGSSDGSVRVSFGKPYGKKLGSRHTSPQSSPYDCWSSRNQFYLLLVLESISVLSTEMNC